MSSTKTVINFYELLALYQESAEDYTDGMYEGNPDRPYAEAQRRQLEFLLDEIGCAKGSTILDIGCGNGTLLEAAKDRGAEAIGITISPGQVSYGRSKDLDVRLLDYRDINDEWDNNFDGVVANGSIEHFVHPEDAIAGKGDDIYRELFAICHRILKPGGRFATTVIHFGNVVIRPQDALKSPFRYPWGSDRFHYSLLSAALGGFYPMPGQLQDNARGLFQLQKEIDGTEDYRLTSEHWLKRARGRPFARDFGQLMNIVRVFLKHPYQTLIFVLSFRGAESWNWQFRGKDPPMTLFRHTWVRQ